MAMRRLTPQQLEDELLRRACSSTDPGGDWGQMWLGPKGYFYVYPPEEPDGKYPDWYLDDLIAKHDLPVAPNKNH